MGLCFSSRVDAYAARERPYAGAGVRAADLADLLERRWHDCPQSYCFLRCLHARDRELFVDTLAETLLETLGAERARAAIERGGVTLALWRGVMLALGELLYAHYDLCAACDAAGLPVEGATGPCVLPELARYVVVLESFGSAARVSSAPAVLLLYQEGHLQALRSAHIVGRVPEAARGSYGLRADDVLGGVAVAESLPEARARRRRGLASRRAHYPVLRLW